MPRKIKPRKNWEPSIPALKWRFPDSVQMKRIERTLWPDGPPSRDAALKLSMSISTLVTAYCHGKDVGRDTWPKPNEILAALAELKKAAQALSDTMASLDAVSRVQLDWAASRRVSGTYHSPLNETPPLPGDDPPKTETAKPTITLEHWRGRERVDLLMKALEDLNSWIADALAFKPQAHSVGRERAWSVGVLASLYEALTGRQFSRTEKGNPTPRDFVTAALGLVEPGLSEGQIEEAMKGVIMKRTAKKRRGLAVGKTNPD